MKLRRRGHEDEPIEAPDKEEMIALSDLAGLIDKHEKRAGQRAVAQYRKVQRERARNRARRTSRKENR